MPHRSNSERIDSYLRKAYAEVEWHAQTGAIADLYFRLFGAPEFISYRLGVSPAEVLEVVDRLEKIYAVDDAFCYLIHGNDDDRPMSLSALTARYGSDTVRRALRVVVKGLFDPHPVTYPAARFVEDGICENPAALGFVGDVARLIEQRKRMGYEDPDLEGDAWGCLLFSPPYHPRGPMHGRRPGNEAHLPSGR